MRFYKGTASKSFLLSETPNGAGTPEEQDTEHTIQLTFTSSEWEEGRPFGSTTAYERMSEIDDTSYVYELDEEEVELDTLHERFGGAWVDALLEQLENDADMKDITNDRDDDCCD